MGHPFRHFFTILKHRHQVIRNGFHMGIFWHCLGHDMSKFSPSEFWTSSAHYQGNSSPLYDERKSKHLFSDVSVHHTGRNRHHWEYWVDFFKGRLVVKTMPWKYATEMVCDMLSASKTYDPKHFSGQVCYEFFLKHKDTIYVTKATEEYITWCLKTYAEVGWKGLKKKLTKEKYAQICADNPEVEIFESLKTPGDLPKL